MNNLQIIPLTRRDIKDIAEYAGFTIGKENLPEDYEDNDDKCYLYYRQNGIKFDDGEAYHIAMRSGVEEVGEFMPIGAKIQEVE